MIILALSEKFSIWVIFFILFVCFALTAGLSFLFFKKFLTKYLTRDQQQIRVIAVMAAISGSLYGILFGLVIVTLWQNFRSINYSVSREASDIAIILLESQILPPSIQNQVEIAIKNYIEKVRFYEWQTMDRREKKQDTETWRAFVNLYQIIQSYQPKSSAELAFYSQMITRLNDALVARRERLDYLAASIPGPVFSVLFLGAGLVIVLLSLALVIAGNYLFFMALIIALFISLGLTVAVDLHTVFTGQLAISSKPFTEDGLHKFQKQ